MCKSKNMNKATLEINLCSNVEVNNEYHVVWSLSLNFAETGPSWNKSRRCLSVEKVTPFVNIFHISAIDFDIVERRLHLYYMSAVFPITCD